LNAEVLAVENRDAKWGFTGTLLWGLLIAAVFVIVQIIVLGAFIVMNHAQAPIGAYDDLLQQLEMDGTVLYISTFATSFICSCLILGVIKLKKNSSLRSYLGLKSVDFRTLGKWLLAMLLLVIASDLLSLALDKPLVPDVMSYAYSTASSPLLFWIALIVAAPIFEELFFRGFLLPGFAASFIKPAGAVLITAALWAVIHLQYDLYGIITIFVMGLLLGAVRLMSGSVLLSIGLHAFSNLIAMLETVIKVS
jgi:uncharacterized protein